MTLVVLAAGCGVLPGTESSSTQGETDGFDAPTPVFNTPFPTATPTPVPTSTPVPSPTSAPVPTATPAVGDSFTTLLRQVRTVFTAADKQAAINALVPAPISLEIPADAELERLQLEFGRWDLWADATGEFPPVDRAASVVVEYSFLTNAEIDDIRIACREPILAEGFTVKSDSVEPGQFSDTTYELNSGLQRPGQGGIARLSALRQGDRNFVQFEIELELNVDGGPAITEWPTLFPVPFPGDFTYFIARGTALDEGVEVSASASWTLGARATDRRAILETVMDEYPTSSIVLSDLINQASDNDVAITTMTHPTGSAGSIGVDVIPEATTIEFRILSLPG